MSTAPRRISEKARSDPQLVFTSLYHHICGMQDIADYFGVGRMTVSRAVKRFETSDSGNGKDDVHWVT